MADWPLIAGPMYPDIEALKYHGTRYCCEVPCVEYHERTCVHCLGLISVYSNTCFTPSLYFRVLVSSVHTAFFSL
jgi:hypothetical protein